MKFIRRSLTWEVKTTIATSLQPWLLLLLPLSSPAASLCVNVNNNAGAAYPYSSWATAATNIQDAVDAAAAGDTVYVTNGVYTLGGKAMAGDLTNRVTLDKALTVQSVNGPLVTAIQGAGATNSTTAVRCAWLTNGASLVGFTLQGGATRLVGDTFTLRSGGAVWGSSTSASVLNCLVISNAAAFYGAAGFQAALINCAVIGNNSAAWVLYSNILKSCTVVSNYGGGTYQCAATNSIIQYNTPGNYAGGAYANCCSSPTPPGGSGNISSAPQLLFDGIHLSATSPCIGAGGYFTAGTDIDGQPWAAPPSIGCDEWKPDPVIITKPTFKLTSDPVGFSVGITVVGQAPFYCWWTRNGSAIEDDGHYSASHATNLVATGIALSDPGAYQVVVSNTAGVATSAVTQLVFHYANPANASSSSPYTTWSAAATNLQDAITAASPGDIILATNGTYATGGKAMVGDLTNRVTLDKPLLLVSVNGPGTTTIQGAYDPASTNGPNAVRCAWLTNNAILSGFTLCSGATRDVTVFVDGTMSGGGVCGSSVSAVVDHCLVVSNYASYQGGGAYRTSLNYCQLVGNRAVGSGMAGAGVAGAGTGGGAAWCNLKNCVVTANYADQGNGGGADTCNLTNCALTGNSSYMNGGGANAGSLLNCTVSGNISSGYTPGYGGAIYGATVTNCILWGNRQRTSNTSTNYASCTLDYCCSSPLSTGTGNIALDPQLLVDGFHLAEASPCHGAGRAGVIIGTDIDSQSWTNPPAIGCDEWQPAPLLISQTAAQPYSGVGQIAVGNAATAGKAPFGYFWTKDGLPLQPGVKYGSPHDSTLVISRFDPSDAGLYQVVISNAFGMATSRLARVVVRCVNAASGNPQLPYSTWAYASTDIQSAIGQAAAGDFVLVTNGLYASGGKAMVPDLTNRVAIDKALTVMSVNGAALTTIQGAWDPTGKTGPAAVRCAWLTNGAALNGFTLTGGATRSGTSGLNTYGGGLYASSISNSLILNCMICSNAAGGSGGGAAYGRFVSCALVGNYAGNSGGGAIGGHFVNCTISGNYASNGGGGNQDGTFTNCIIAFNANPMTSIAGLPNDVVAGTFVNCCVPSLSLGGGNTSADPQLMDGYHLATASPCRGVGVSVTGLGTDVDGDPWLSPPSMGCDEVVDSAFAGPLGVAIQLPANGPLVNHAYTLAGLVTGRASRVQWSFGDGPAVTTASSTTAHTWTSTGDYTITFTAYNADHPAGVSASQLVHISLPDQPLLLAPSITTSSFGFQYTGQLSALYITELATNLAPPLVWQPIFTNYGAGYLFEFRWPGSTDPARFYRVRAQ